MKKICYIILILLTLVLMDVSVREFRNAASLDLMANAEIIEMYTDGQREYCVYSYVSNRDMKIARDMMYNIKQHSIGDMVEIHYDSADDNRVSYYKNEIITVFCAALTIQVIFLMIVLLKVVRK